MVLVAEEEEVHPFVLIGCVGVTDGSTPVLELARTRVVASSRSFSVVSVDDKDGGIP